MCSHVWTHRSEDPHQASIYCPRYIPESISGSWTECLRISIEGEGESVIPGHLNNRNKKGEKLYNEILSVGKMSQNFPGVFVT